MAPHDFLASGSPSDSDSSSRRSSWAALMQEYEDAIEYRSDGARSDTDGDAEVVTKMAQLDIKATDTSPSTGKMADAEFQTVIESTAVAAAVQVSQITIDAAIERSLQRRKVLEELISTEEGYIGDVRFLMNNLTEIVKLHEELLGELHRVVPHSEYTQADLAPSLSTLPNADCLHTHRRWSSLDAIPEQNVKARWLLKAPGMLSDPQVAAEVSKVFAKKISRFFMYEEYGATYEMMIKDIASAQEAMPDWETYQKGLEALALALGSAKGSEEGTKKALTVNDLLVKPIQRICKYPLLFFELLKCTPISDCPNSHMEIDNTLTRLREATTEINRASNDDQIRVTLEKTWILQDRLAFPDRTDDGVDGQYFICLLYRDVLCLAAAGKVDPIYTIRACINVDGIRIEDVDNGRACNPKEETEWKTRLTRPMSEDQERKSPSTLARRISIQRATTVGSAKSPLCQVILKNTNGLRDNSGTASTASTIKRSQSLLTTTTRIPVLAPPRGERARLEALLSDVWTREILPFPGMSMRSRSENLVRSSASTVMRKLSVASFASSFAKKSTAPAQRAQSIENIALETIKRRDMRTPMESMLRDEACMDAEAGRSAKRQRTTKELAGVQAPVHSSRDGPRSLRRRGAWVGKQDLVSDVYSFPSRAASANMLLPSKLTISRAMTSLPETPDRTRKASAERFRSFGRWTRIGVGRNEGTGSFRKLLSIGKEL
ncbi:hypothetical protein MKX07_001118 [Trichoderma sp. CBMAI-0711]|nr:hypothetical protein MKX07_001118 [Trichoderma sp. CBMAI-0711]